MLRCQLCNRDIRPEELVMWGRPDGIIEPKNQQFIIGTQVHLMYVQGGFSASDLHSNSPMRTLVTHLAALPSPSSPLLAWISCQGNCISLSSLSPHPSSLPYPRPNSMIACVYHPPPELAYRLRQRLQPYMMYAPAGYQGRVQICRFFQQVCGFASPILSVYVWASKPCPTRSRSDFLPRRALKQCG